MLGRNNDLISKGINAEDNMKFSIIRHESQEALDANMYKESAKRVVFKNCMSACEIEQNDLPNFNKNFYYNQIREQKCLQDCYNTRMMIHFGSSAKEQGMWIDFNEMKQEYKRYERWNPKNRLQAEYLESFSEAQVKDITQSLLNKSKERFGKFDF